MGNPPCAGTTGDKSPPHSPTTQLPTDLLPHSSPLSIPTQIPPTAPPTQSWGSFKPTGTGEGAGHIRASEECAQCEGTHEYTLPAHRGGGCLIPLTAATSLHVVTHSVISVHNDYSYVHTCVYGVQIRQGVCCRGTQRMHKRCKH